MSAAAKSVFGFGLYLVGMGAGFVLAPNLLLGMFGLPPTAEVWVRVVGVLALLLAFYYVQAARHELRPMLVWTVYARAVVIVFFGGFVLAGLVSPVLALFGAVDLAAALWTAWALRADGKRAVQLQSSAAK